MCCQSTGVGWRLETLNHPSPFGIAFMDPTIPPYDFGTGNTNPETFPAEAFAASAAKVIATMAVDLNRYPGKLGHPALRQLMADRESTREGVPVDPDNMFLINGSMQGVTLAAETLCELPGGIVVMEEHCYSGTVNAYKALGVDMVGVPLDGHGMRMDALDAALTKLADEGRKAGFIYVLTSYQNPTGAMMPTERRLELIEIARRHDTVVVEDNCYGDVHFEGEKAPSLFALDNSPNQIYLGSLSKIFAPGVRLGYVLARQPMLDRLLARRHDAGPNTLAAAISHEYLHDKLWEHIEMANVALKRKRDVMLESLEAHLGNECSWSRPVGGLFIWIRLPEGTDLDALETQCTPRGVTFARGATFNVTNEDIPYIRLAFGYPTEEQIRTGIAELGAAIRAM
jgi:2-aminoadipate transaminase